MDSLSVQLYAFAVTMIAGASIGFIFDLYRVIRSLLRPGAVVTVVMDLFFWVVAAPVIIIYLLMANWGELRLYVLIGIVLGSAFYYLLFSSMVIRLFISLLNLIGHIISFLCQLFFSIVVWPVKVLQDLFLTFNARRRGELIKFESGWRFAVEGRPALAVRFIPFGGGNNLLRQQGKSGFQNSPL